MTLMTLMTNNNNPLAAIAAEPAKITTPNDWLDQEYPGLVEKHGQPFLGGFIERNLVNEKGEKEKLSIWVPTALNERFFAALITREANANTPAVFDAEEKKWFRYLEGGCYRPILAETLYEDLRVILLGLSRKCQETSNRLDPDNLEFKFRKTSTLAPVVVSASGIAAVTSEFWERPPLMIPLHNGIYSILDARLLPHSPDFHFREVLGANYQAYVTAPRWQKLLDQALPDKDDQVLLQKLFGQLLLGKNQSQHIVLMHGEAQSGKGTIARVMVDFVGRENMATLRTDQLNGRFEMARFRHKLLLYGPDVSGNFLNEDGAYLLKSITGEDPISPEYKNSNATPRAEPIHALPVITSNSRLRIRFEGDKEAWRRRLIVFEFAQAVDQSQRVTGLSDKLLAEEGAGIFNWALEGVMLLADANLDIVLSERQAGIRDALLDESESYMAFAREAITTEKGAQLTTDQAWTEYVQFCTVRHWAPVTEYVFQRGFKQAMVDLYGITQSHSLVTGDERRSRGWRGLTLDENENPNSYPIYSDRTRRMRGTGGTPVCN